jgi:gamma-carbonic anhydrase
VRQPSLRCIPISESKYPKLLDSDWVAPNAVVVGDVQLGEGSSLWHGVIVRGDTAAVSIGKNTSVQDLTRIASSQRAPGDQVKIGENCYIGANVSMDACTIEDNSFVGMGASVGRGARIEPFAVVSAGAVIPAGTTVPSGQIFAGAPARYLRDLTQEEKHLMTEHKLEMQQMSQIYEEHTSKTFREQLNHRDELDKYRLQDVQDKFEDMLGEMGMPTTHEDFEYIEHRIYHDYTG